MEVGREWLWAAAGLYALSFLIALVSLVRNRRYNRTVLMSGLGLGLLLQTGGLYLRGLETGGCPVGNPFELIQFVSWSAMVLYFLVGPAFRMSLLGFFSSGLAAVAGLGSLFFPGLDETTSSRFFGGNPWIEAHAALAVFSYGIFGVLALTSIMHLFQNYGLKEKRAKGVFAFLPSILELDQMNVRLLVVGLTVLTLSLIPGVGSWMEEPDRVTSLKLASTLLVWGAYWVLFLSRQFRQLPSVRFSLCALILFGFTMLSLVPVDRSRLPASEQTEVLP